MNTRAAGLALMTSLLFACETTTDDPDDRDAGSTSNVRDAGDTARDAGEIADAGTNADAGSTDAGSTDAGAMRDGGPGASRDAGEARDAGSTRDGGSVRDAGPRPVVCNPTFGPTDACGGDPVGVWTYAAACTDQDFYADLATICPGVQVSNQLVTTGGTVELRANGTFTRSVTTVVTADSSWPAVCATQGCSAIQQLLTLNGLTASCSPGGGGCDCTISGEVGTFDNGAYTVNGSVIVADGLPYDFCVDSGVFEYRGTAQNAADNVFSFVLTP
ncbi:MAG: hypothetical protein RMA76_02015 [Deltaproteobacteria bacterium]